MKFACPKCATRYNVADSKVPQDKTLRFTCKKCQHVFRLRRKAKESTSTLQALATGTGGPDPSMTLPGADLAPPGQVESTRIANLNEIVAMKKRSAEDSVAKPAPTGASPFAGEDEWFVLIDGKQEGPLTPNEVRSKLQNGEIDQRTYAWCEGMDDWLRLSGIDDFADAISGDGAWRVVTPKGAVPKDKKAPKSKGKPKKSIDEVSVPGPQPGEVSTDVVPMAVGPVGGGFADDGFGDDSTNPFAQVPESSPDSLDNGVSRDEDDGYFEAPPGEATRVFMATAGIYKRRRQHKIAAIVGSIATVILLVIIAGDITGLYRLPGMGAVYDMTGVEDPNADRAIERTEKKLAKSDLTPEEKAALRAKLLGLTTKKSTKPSNKRKVPTRPKVDADAPTVGIEEKTGTMDANKKSLAMDIFNDTRKQSKAPTLKKVTELQTPNLPDGLTQDSIFKVINDNTRSMSLCITQSMKAGEKLTGKMEVEMSILATGKVSEASIQTARFRNSTIGKCTVKTVRRWKFPRFNGEPVTVIFPYVLSAGF